MDRLLTALQAAFDASPLATTFADGLYHNLGPNDLPRPLCSVTITTDATDYDTGDDFETVYRVHFDVWADSDTTVLNALRALKDLLMFKPLDVEGHLLTVPVDGTEGIDREDEIVWRGTADYRISVEETLQGD